MDFSDDISYLLTGLVPKYGTLLYPKYPKLIRKSIVIIYIAVGQLAFSKVLLKYVVLAPYIEEKAEVKG